MQSVEEVLLDWEREMPEVGRSALPPVLRALHFAALVRQFEERVLEPFEIGPNEYAALSVLRRRGAPYHLNATLLAERTAMTSGGLTKMLRRLEARELITREMDPEDGRGKRVVLTRRGLDLQTRVLRAFVAASENRLQPLEAEERSQYDLALARWASVLER